MEICYDKQEYVETVPFSEIKPGELFVTASIFKTNETYWHKFVLQKCFSDLNLPTNAMAVRLSDGKIFNYLDCNSSTTPCVILEGELSTSLK